jgi:hypothetical protein
VTVCALLLAEVWIRTGNRELVLVLARPVAAGQVITAADLRAVRLGVSGVLPAVPAGREQQVTGRPAAAALPPGTLLAAADIGAPSPARGQARLGVAVKTGRYPPGLSPGQHVDVLDVPASLGIPAARPAGQGVVLSVTAGPEPGETVVDLQVPQTALAQVAAASAAGQAVLAAIPEGR